MFEILILPAASDNYIYVIRDHKNVVTVVIDPTDADVVLAFLNEKKWTLQYILNTHHHMDHVHGNMTLKTLTGCQIVGSKVDAKRIPGIDIMLSDGDSFYVGSLKLQVMDVSGHTLGHIAYYAKELDSLFSGDVLFGLGCGRVFEGTHTQMFKAILKIKELPEKTKIYCSHEYAEKNIDFALHFEASNPNLVARIELIRAARAAQKFTVPLHLKEELQTNPFLRTNQTSLQNSLNIKDELALFSHLRNYRDQI
jgi:hydroxyacylglutathione hydrolase